MLHAWDERGMFHRGDRMRFMTMIVLLLSAQALIALSSAMAEEAKGDAPWAQSCRHYHSSRHFVSESALYCLRQTEQKVCQQHAQKYFEHCNFTGDFQKMSARISARMLLVLALTSVRSVHHLDL